MELKSASGLLAKMLGCFLAIIWLASVSYAAIERVPEVDSGLAAGSIALVVGSYLVVAAKVRRKK